MNKKKMSVMGLAVLALGACTQPSVVTRAADPGTALLSQGGGGSVAAPSYKVVDVRVSVPETLSVSEANTLIPRADIVWRGDPYGDRRQQVATIMRDGIMAGTASLNGSREVVVEIEMARFHALTQRARYTVGGNHNIDFWMQVVDAQTGAVIEPRRFVNTDLPAYGGMAAVAAEARGETQKVRIESFIGQTLANELSKPHVIPVAAAE